MAARSSARGSPTPRSSAGESCTSTWARHRPAGDAASGRTRCPARVPPMPSPLAGRRALVTGGATGIGRATAKRLASDGASVVINYVGPPDQANSAVDEIGHAIAIEADVSNEDQVTAMFERASRELGGPIDLLVNNAGIEK